MGRAIDLPGLGAAGLGAVALVFAAVSQPLAAQQALVTAPSPAEAPAVPPVVPVTVVAATPQLPSTPAPAGCPPLASAVAPCIPALTPVRLVIRAHLGSKISLTDQTFPIALAQPIVIDGKELIPAGTTGMGEVVHAKKSGGSGASGELVLAARFLDVGGRRLRLRSLNFAQAGEDNIGTAIVASAFLSIAGFLVKGKGIDVPEGTEALAKTAEAFVLNAPITAPPAPASTIASPPPEQGAIP